MIAFRSGASASGSISRTQAQPFGEPHVILGVSKSSVHKDMDERLPRINQTLYRQVRSVLSYNKSVRHLRGGEATRRKYLHS